MEPDVTTLDIDTSPPPARFTPDPSATMAERVSDLLIALERAAPRAPVLMPLADLRPANDGSGDLFVFATVFVGALRPGDVARPYALHEVRLAADCLDVDPPFPAAPSLAPALRAAADQAEVAAAMLQSGLA
jgi:hypothetical protein